MLLSAQAKRKSGLSCDIEDKMTNIPELAQAHILRSIPGISYEFIKYVVALSTFIR